MSNCCYGGSTSAIIRYMLLFFSLGISTFNGHVSILEIGGPAPVGMC